MKIKIIGLLGIIAIGVVTLAAGLEPIEIQSSAESPQTIFVISDSRTVAEIKMIKPGSIKILGDDIRVAMQPGGKKIYNLTNSSAEIFVNGKSALKLSADALRIQN